MRTAASLVLVPVVLLGSLLGLAAPAQAHAGLVSSTPADGGTVLLADGAGDVAFEFNQPLLTDGAFVVVLDASGAEASTGDLRLDGAVAGRSFEGEAGTYTATYRVVSQDGHPISGSITFTAIAGESETSADETPVPSTTPTTQPPTGAADPADRSADGVPTWVYLVAVPVVLVAGYAAFERLRRRR